MAEYRETVIISAIRVQLKDNIIIALADARLWVDSLFYNKPFYVVALINTRRITTSSRYRYHANGDLFVRHMHSHYTEIYSF